MANILVVDDEMGIRELLSEILSDEGHAIETAENAQQARALRLSWSPDLVLLDIWMPDTDGVTLLKEWQRDGLLSVPVIMMSGHATIDTAVEATRIGALNFLEKPIALQKLLKAVQQGLLHNREPARTTSHIRPTTVLTDVIERPPTALYVAPSAETPHTAFTPLGSTANISFEQPLREARDAFEQAYFEYHLMRNNGSMTRVAECTGLERTHLYRKLKQLGVESGKCAKKP